jgi:hypothetical protein
MILCASDGRIRTRGSCIADGHSGVRRSPPACIVGIVDQAVGPEAFTPSVGAEHTLAAGDIRDPSLSATAGLGPDQPVIARDLLRSRSLIQIGPYMNGTDDEDQPINSSPASTEKLGTSMLELAALTSRQGQTGLEDSLRHIATVAVEAIPGAEGVGVTLHEERGRADTMVSSTQFVHDVDAIQYGMGEGPCITAAATARTVTSASLGDDPQWPRFGPAVQRHGVNSVLSLPLQHDGRVLGAMNVYAHPRNAFNAEAITAGEAFAIPAAISVQNAQVLARGIRTAQELRRALTERSAIDRAVGVLIDRDGSSERQALDVIRSISTTRAITLPEAAWSVIQAALTRPARPDARE